MDDDYNTNSISRYSHDSYIYGHQKAELMILHENRQQKQTAEAKQTEDTASQEDEDEEVTSYSHIVYDKQETSMISDNICIGWAESGKGKLIKTKLLG